VWPDVSNASEKAHVNSLVVDETITKNIKKAMGDQSLSKGWNSIVEMTDES